MTPFEALTEQDKNMIVNYIQWYGGSEGNGADVNVTIEHILRFWNMNKNNLFHIFGEHLIHERDICIQTPKTILYENMEAITWHHGGIYRELAHPFIKEFQSWAYDVTRGCSYEVYDDLNSLVSIETLSDNIYYGDSVAIKADQKELLIPKGIKAMKAFSKIVNAFPNAFSIEDFEDFRLKHSQVLNQKIFRGTLCLSIHPLDYMTMSDNDYNWDSCMSWQKPGEYRMGTVEMMNSNCVVVAYLKGTKDMNLGRGLMWNNKRWRELFIVDKNILTNIKGYPFKDPGLEVFILDWLKELATAAGYSYKDAIDTIDDYNCIGYDNLFFYPMFSIMYNDYYNKHFAHISENIFKDCIIVKDNEYRYALDISGQTECMGCGEDLSEDYSSLESSHLLCSNCSGEVCCPICGDCISESETVSLGNDTVMCRYCFENFGAFCSCCEKPYHVDNLTTIYLVHDGTTLDDNIDICGNCLNNDYIDDLGEIAFGRFLGRRTAVLRSGWQADSRNLTDNGFYLFGFNDEDIAEMRAENAAANEQKES